MASRRVRQRTSDTPSATEHVAATTSARPTAAELQEAQHVVRMMKEMDPPLLARTAPANPNVVACAIALRRGERFETDSEALQLFGVAPRTNVRNHCDGSGCSGCWRIARTQRESRHRAAATQSTRRLRAIRRVTRLSARIETTGTSASRVSASTGSASHSSARYATPSRGRSGPTAMGGLSVSAMSRQLRLWISRRLVQRLGAREGSRNNTSVSGPRPTGALLVIM